MKKKIDFAVLCFFGTLLEEGSSAYRHVATLVFQGTVTLYMRYHT